MAARRLTACALLVVSLVAVAVPRTVMVSVAADSENAGYEGVNALDGDSATMWHTPWGAAETKLPHTLTIDLTGEYVLTGFRYQRRLDGVNGSIGKYAILVSPDGKAWGQPVAQGMFAKKAGAETVVFPAPVKARFVRLRALSEVGGRQWTSVAELELLSEGVQFRSRALPGARRHGGTQAAVARKRQGPDTSTLAGALEMARLTLDFVQEAAPRPELAAELAALEKRVPEQGDDETLRKAALALRRRTILSHPALAFERLLINKRPPPTFQHQTDQYLGRHNGIGDGLVVLDHWRSETPTETVLLRGQLPPGTVQHPDLSFDATRILFSYCDQTVADPKLRRSFIHEVNVDGTGLHQLTGTASDPMTTVDGRHTVLIEDWDPCYLPDGGFAFVSTRNQGGVRCHHGGRYCPTYLLYRADAGGRNIRPMSHGEANEWDPSVLPDGRIIWTRWDYINRHDTIYQSLWTTRPDGTGTAHFYGNYTRNPCNILEARCIPGSRKVVGTAAAHHAYTAGSVIVIDPAQGEDGPAPLERVTPEVAFPETEGYPVGAYATPWPLNEDLFLVAYTPERLRSQGKESQKKNAYAIYLVDTLGGRELIYRDPEMSCFAPIPLVPRPCPPVLPSMLPENAPPEGRVYVRNARRSTQPIPDEVAALRVVRVYPQPVQRVPDRGEVLFEVSKGVVGLAPVARDGSVAFTAPANEPLLFQLVDRQGQAVMGMRTFVYLQPGETMSCMGCHEPRRSAPGLAKAPARQAYPKLTPPVGPRYAGGLSFTRTVQPVLDRHCVSCHGLKEKPAGGLSLLGTMDPSPVHLGHARASAAYDALTKRKGLVVVAHRNRESAYSRPGDYGARAGRLAEILRTGHKGRVKLSAEEFRRVAQWLDLNAPFYGGYSWNKPEWRQRVPAAETRLRAAIADRFGEEVSTQPFAALVNVGDLEQSRILLAGLPVAAGGWGQLGPAFSGREDPGWQHLRSLVMASLAPLPAHDVAGTCQQADCQCRACWVPKAEAAYRDALHAGTR
jgi:mono/diheme cytochrome c family protein